MDNTTANDLLEELDDNIDELEAALKPLLDAPIETTAANMDLLEKAKLYTWTSYALENLLFNYLRLSGLDGKSHPVFTELKRIQQYMQKIEAAADPNYGKPATQVNMAVAGRFIKHGLAGNEKWDKERAEMEENERQKAKRKLVLLESKMAAEGRLDQIKGSDVEKAARKESKRKRKEENAKLATVDGIGASPDTARGTPRTKKPKKNRAAT